MPISLFPELTAQLVKTGKVLSPWARLVTIEQTLLRRAQSAYLTHWFGRGRVPTKDISLHIAIRNVGALRDQYLLAKRSMPEPVPGLNLFGPLAGYAGLVVGAAMSPTGFALIISQFGRIKQYLFGGKSGWDQFIMVLKIIGALILLPLFPVLGPGLGLFAASLMVIGNDPTTRSIVMLTGELAAFIEAMSEFWKQLSGPRSEIRNPLLKFILETLDKVAGLFAQLLGAIGLIFEKLLPVIPSLIAQFEAMMTLVDTVIEALKDTLKGVLDALLHPFEARPSVLTILDRLVEMLMELPDKIFKSVTELIEDTITDVGYAIDAIGAELKAYGKGLGQRIEDGIHASALWILKGRIQTMAKILPLWVKAYKDAKEPKDDEESTLDTLKSKKAWAGAKLFELGDVRTSAIKLLESVEKLKKQGIPDLPDLKLPDIPGAPTLPDVDKILKANPLPEAPDFGTIATDLFKEAKDAYGAMKLPPEFKSPRSAFAGERKALEETMPMPKLELANPELRDLIYIAVGRVLPPALREYAPEVRALFDKLDSKLYGAKEGTEAEKEALQKELLPVQDLGDTGLLYPKIKKLRFVGPNAEAPDLRAFRDLVVKQVEIQTYEARANSAKAAA